MGEFFCPHCGIKTNGNAGLDLRGGHFMHCPVCGFKIRLLVEVGPSKTDEEVEAAFQNTPLTDSQHYGGGKRKFKK